MENMHTSRFNGWIRSVLGTAMLLSACSGGSGSGADVDAAGELADARTPADATPDAAPAAECDNFVALPVTSTTLRGFSGAEDFAFDADGNLVSTRSGNLVRQPKDGAATLMSPNIGETAGTRFLSNGDLVIAQVDNGELWRVKPDGTTSVILSGIDYPNGVEVDQNDFVYVAEQNAGHIRRVNPDTGEFTIIGEGLYNPNGLSFSPDYKSLYANSFGQGSVHSITVDSGGTWGAPVLLGSVFDPDTTVCDAGEIGDLCVQANQPGVCEELVANQRSCELAGNGAEPFRQACSGASQNAKCTVSIGSHNFPGNCENDNGVLACETNLGQRTVCQGQSKGSSCRAAVEDFGAFDGTCRQSFGGALRCSPNGYDRDRGGLDGMTVDACGNVYITEYIEGVIWRFTPEGVREKVIDLPSFWIPNMHWGTGLGGWQEDTLYVMDREEGRVFELVLGVEEKEKVFP